MKIVNQLLIFSANKPGVLANICGSLNDENVNILALSIVDHIDHAVIRLVVDNTTKAVHLLGESGLPVHEDQVIEIELKNGPGGLEKVANAVADVGINIHYAYASENKESTKSLLIIKTDDDMKAIKVLREKLDPMERD